MAGSYTYVIPTYIFLEADEQIMKRWTTPREHKTPAHFADLSFWSKLHYYRFQTPTLSFTLSSRCWVRQRRPSLPYGGIFIWIVNFWTSFFFVEIQAKKTTRNECYACFFHHLYHRSHMYVTFMPSPLAREPLSRSLLLCNVPHLTAQKIFSYIKFTINGTYKNESFSLQYPFIQRHTWQEGASFYPLASKN